MLRISRRGEEQTAKELGGRRQPASGATPFAKGDVKTPDWLVERKDTSQKSYSLKESDLNKVRMQGLHMDRDFVFQVSFVGGRSYAIIDWDKFVEMTRAEH